MPKKKPQPQFMKVIVQFDMPVGLLLREVAKAEQRNLKTVVQRAIEAYAEGSPELQAARSGNGSVIS